MVRLGYRGGWIREHRRLMLAEPLAELVLAPPSWIGNAEEVRHRQLEERLAVVGVVVRGHAGAAKASSSATTASC